MRLWLFQLRPRWAQIFTDGRMPLECGTGQRLILTNVTYEQQGQYICLASNKINGNVREVKSDPVSLQVVGAPRVRRKSNSLRIVRYPLSCTRSRKDDAALKRCNRTANYYGRINWKNSVRRKIEQKRTMVELKLNRSARHAMHVEEEKRGN